MVLCCLPGSQPKPAAATGATYVNTWYSGEGEVPSDATATAVTTTFDHSVQRLLKIPTRSLATVVGVVV